MRGEAGLVSWQSQKHEVLEVNYWWFLCTRRMVATNVHCMIVFCQLTARIVCQLTGGKDLVISRIRVKYSLLLTRNTVWSLWKILQSHHTQSQRFTTWFEHYSPTPFFLLGWIETSKSRCLCCAQLLILIPNNILQGKEQEAQVSDPGTWKVEVGTS